MNTVRNLEEIDFNIKMLNKYLKIKVDPEYEFAISRIKKGTCFVADMRDVPYKFYPSRYIGYTGNSMNAHLNNDQKDGRETNPAISSILGSKPESNTEIDSKYQEFCQTLGIIASEKGCFGVARKYWKLTK